MEDVPGIITKPRTRKQWMAAIQVGLMTMMFMSSNGWISMYLGKLIRPDPPFPATKEQLSWVASISSMARIVGIITGSIGTNFLGTKTSLYLCGFYFVVSWVSLICANSINIVLTSQLWCGLGHGSVITVFSLYLSEIVNANIRGTIISFVMNCGMLGLLYGNLLGAHTDAWVFGLVNLVITAIYLVIFYFLPSTPHYLISRNKLVEAEKALRYYNCRADVKEEFDKLHEFIKSSPRVSVMESLRRLKEPINLRTFVMINIIYSLVQFSGTYALLEYQEVIIMASNIEVILPSTLVTIMSAVTLPARWVAVAVGDKFGRVTMLTTSCVIFCISFVVWGLSFHLLELGFSTSQVQWLVIVCSVVYRFNMSAGLSPIVPVLIGEMFAPNVKSVSACLVNITSALCIFISVKNFQTMVDHMTYKYLFYFYAALILVVGIYIKLYVPETRGKTLREIQEMLQKKYLAKNKKVPTEIYVNTICEQTRKGDGNNPESGM